MAELVSFLDTSILFPFLLLLARILAFMAFMPIFGHTAVSPTIRVALSFYFAVFLYPLIGQKPVFSEMEFLLGLVSEITLGFIAAFFVNIVFSAVRIIGELISYATSLSMGAMFDPASGSQETFMSRLLFYIAVLIYFQTGMYEITVLMLAKSFDMIHLGTFNLFNYDGVTIMIDEINRMFAFAFAFAFPLFFISFILDIYYGYGTKAMPAFSPFVITFQLKFAIIFLFMMLGLETFADSFQAYFSAKFQG